MKKIKKPEYYLISTELINLISMILHLQKTVINDANEYYWSQFNGLHESDSDGHHRLQDDLRHLFELKGMADGLICELSRIMNDGAYTDDCLE